MLTRRVWLRVLVLLLLQVSFFLVTSVVFASSRSGSIDNISPSSGFHMEPGASQAILIRVKNTGTQQDDFRVTHSGLPSGWSLQSSELADDVPENSTRIVTFTLKAPSSGGRPISTGILMSVPLTSSSQTLVCHFSAGPKSKQHFTQSKPHTACPRPLPGLMAGPHRSL